MGLEEWNELTIETIILLCGEYGEHTEILIEDGKITRVKENV